VRFPWQKRADQERNHRLKDEERLEDVRNGWSEVHHVRAELHAAYGPNGWTGIAAKLFANRKESSH
jgi:hypothetical protein